MKKQENKFLRKLLIAVLTVLPLLVIYQVIIKDVKKLNAHKNEMIEELREKENKLEQKKVAYQKLTSEDEIVKKAKDRFKLVRIDHLDNININSNQIKNLEKMISKRYGK